MNRDRSLGDGPGDELEATIWAHEFLIGALLAARLASMPEKQALIALAELRAMPFELAPGAGPMPLEELQERAGAVRAVIGQILDDVQDKQRQIRAVMKVEK